MIQWRGSGHAGTPRSVCRGRTFVNSIRGERLPQVERCYDLLVIERNNVLFGGEDRFSSHVRHDEGKDREEPI